jgi:hypothetical protein
MTPACRPARFGLSRGSAGHGLFGLPARAASSAGGGKPQEPRPDEGATWRLIRRGIKLAIGLGCALAAAPSVLSLPPVTRAACGLASSALPGQVQVRSLRRRAAGAAGLARPPA